MAEKYDGSSARNEYFPVYGGKTVAKLYFDYPPNMGPAAGSSGELSDLAAVRIVTTETAVGDYKFLGKFRGSDVYYYTMYDDDRQTWKLHRAYPAREGNLVFGEVIYIQNVSDGQYLCPDGDYLSTQAQPFGWHTSKA